MRENQLFVHRSVQRGGVQRDAAILSLEAVSDIEIMIDRERAKSTAVNSVVVAQPLPIAGVPPPIPEGLDPRVRLPRQVLISCAENPNGTPAIADIGDGIRARWLDVPHTQCPRVYPINANSFRRASEMGGCAIIRQINAG